MKLIINKYFSVSFLLQFNTGANNNNDNRDRTTLETSTSVQILTNGLDLGDDHDESDVVQPILTRSPEPVSVNNKSAFSWSCTEDSSDCLEVTETFTSTTLLRAE